MLGYTEEDIYKMMACISIAQSYMPPNAGGEQVVNGLGEAYNFLDGILAEGHVG